LLSRGAGREIFRSECGRKLRLFFQHEYIVLRAVDRFIAEQARELIWKYGVKPKDSIHLATAIRWRIPTIDSFDDTDMGSLDGKLGDPAIRIGHPHEPEELASKAK
jgi:predicted nucleic acid-binding protein